MSNPRNTFEQIEEGAKEVSAWPLHLIVAVLIAATFTAIDAMVDEINREPINAWLGFFVGGLTGAFYFSSANQKK